MNAPLGTHIGNALEVIEAIEYLKGNYLPDTQIITEALTAEMLISAGLVCDKDTALHRIREAVSSGKALQKFEQMITAQGGDAKVCSDYSRFAQVKSELPVLVKQVGYVQSINSASIGYALIGIKAGRKKVSDHIDYGAGAVLYPKVGDKISRGQQIGLLFSNDKSAGEQAIKRIVASYKISPEPVPAEDLIIGRMNLDDLSD